MSNFFSSALKGVEQGAMNLGRAHLNLMGKTADSLGMIEKGSWPDRFAKSAGANNGSFVGLLGDIVALRNEMRNGRRKAPAEFFPRYDEVFRPIAPPQPGVTVNGFSSTPVLIDGPGQALGDYEGSGSGVSGPAPAYQPQAGQDAGLTAQSISPYDGRLRDAAGRGLGAAIGRPWNGMPGQGMAPANR